MGKLPDEEAACNIIKYRIEYDRKNKVSKTITLQLFYEAKSSVSAVSMIQYNLKTNNIQSSNCIKWKRKSISPTTNQKLHCTNTHALEVLNTHRQHSHKTLRICFSDSFGKNISHIECIRYNPNTGNVSVLSSLQGNHGHILPIINIG